MHCLQGDRDPGPNLAAFTLGARFRGRPRRGDPVDLDFSLNGCDFCSSPQMFPVQGYSFRPKLLAAQFRMEKVEQNLTG